MKFIKFFFTLQQAFFYFFKINEGQTYLVLKILYSKRRKIGFRLRNAKRHIFMFIKSNRESKATVQSFISV
jgi:hypothetical protein